MRIDTCQLSLTIADRPVKHRQTTPNVCTIGRKNAKAPCSAEALRSHQGKSLRKCMHQIPCIEAVSPSARDQPRARFRWWWTNHGAHFIQAFPGSDTTLTVTQYKNDW